MSHLFPLSMRINNFNPKASIRDIRTGRDHRIDFRRAPRRDVTGIMATPLRSNDTPTKVTGQSRSHQRLPVMTRIMRT